MNSNNVPLYYIKSMYLLKKIDIYKLYSQPQEYSEEIIHYSKLFDYGYYMVKYSDVLKAKMDPVYHYVAHGAVENRDPTSWFNTEFYVNKNLGLSKINPFVHYIVFGYLHGLQVNEQ